MAKPAQITKTKNSASGGRETDGADSKGSRTARMKALFDLFYSSAEQARRLGDRRRADQFDLAALGLIEAAVDFPQHLDGYIDKSESAFGVYIPIASIEASRRPSSDLEAKKKQLSDLLSKCAEIAGDHAELLNLTRKHPLFQKAGGPPALYEPKRSRATTEGKSPGEVVEAVYTPPEGKYLRLDHLAHIDYRLYKLYNTWASRKGGHTIEGLITKSEYLALVVTRLKQLGYSEELLASIGVSLQQQKKRPRTIKKRLPEH